MVAPRVLTDDRLVGLDTTVFIYALENHPEFGAACRRLLARVQDGELRAVISALVLGELLVRPLRDGQYEVARGYSDLLASYRNLVEVAADRPICLLAAELRAGKPGLRLPDAIHLATAISRGAARFVTSDERLDGIPGLAVIRPN